jgi:chromosome segregation ATPase
LQNKLLETQELLENNQKTKRNMESQLEDLRIELKGKENRILSLESDRNDLQEKHSNMKIEYETQKTEIINLRTQVETKDKELERWQKDLEVLRERQEAIAKDAFQSRDAVAEFERERELYETKIRDLNRELDEAKQNESKYEKKLNETQKELEKSQADIDSLIDDQKRLVKKTENLTTAVETLRINLAKNPKYAILFVLQDIQQASVGELAKTVAIQLVFAARLMKEPQQEGWIDFNEDTGLVRLKRPLLEVE